MVAEHIREIDPTADILLLLGRDILRVHKVSEQVNGPRMGASWRSLLRWCSQAYSQHFQNECT